ncbi:Lsr2 family protein [Mycolicibacterium sp. CH28]|uniref:histone-like nucleoid-structuring protein Lsr2 n=1 Tax=Mycolicibacterium sp. CH28 TaxID=2512237 RepID=UPI001080BA28|nr:Lsr2 family protein [Mycolicibacterium sp. CH28]TGD84237.1 Lsr2 family protein [Mycolicibacterium sp. CH28]
MAERIVRQLIDDLDGAEIPDGGGERIEFSFRGVDYHIDLSAANVAKFNKAIKPYIDAAANVAGDGRVVRKNDGAAKTNGGGRARRSKTNGRVRAKGDRNGNGRGSADQMAAIREWARNNGHVVAERGRIKSEVVEAFAAAH